MTRSILGRLGVCCTVMSLVWVSACCQKPGCNTVVKQKEPEPKKIYVDKYETVKCPDCPKPKYVYKKAPPLPEKVIRVHRIVVPCPAQRTIEVQLPPDKQKVKYEYLDEGTCKKPEKSWCTPCKPKPKPCT